MRDDNVVRLVEIQLADNVGRLRETARANNVARFIALATTRLQGLERLRLQRQCCKEIALAIALAEDVVKLREITLATTML